MKSLFQASGSQPEIFWENTKVWLWEVPILSVVLDYVAGGVFYESGEFIIS